MSEYSWPGPAWQDLDIQSNCTAYGPYASWVLDRAGEPPLPAVLSFWRVFQNSSSSDADVLEWHEWVRANRGGLAQGIGKQLQTASKCRDALCAAVDGELPQSWWLFAFGVPAALITLHYIMALLRRFVKTQRLAQKEDKPNTVSSILLWRTTQAFGGTAAHVFSAAAVVNLAIQSATLVSLARPPSNPSSPWTAFLTTGAFFLLAATVPLVIPTSRAKWLKTTIFSLLFLISTAAWAVSISDSEAMFSDDADDFARLCPHLVPHTGALQAAVFTAAGMVWMPPLFGICVLLLLCFFRCNGRRMWRTTWVGTVARLAAALYGFVNLVALWGTVGTLSAYVNRVPQGHRKSAWGMEQILFVAVWAPIVAVLVQQFYKPASASERHQDALDEKAKRAEDELLLRR